MQGTCNPANGLCSNPNIANGTACNDGNACTDGDVCTNGVCGGTAYACAAPDQCHQPGTCNGDGTCSFANRVDGTGCNDGNACTQNDVCTGGVCGGSPYTCTATACQASSTCNGNGGCTIAEKASGAVCPDDGNPCTGDVCDGSGNCTHPTLPEGTICGAGLVCNGSVCSSGCVIGGTFYAAGAANPGNQCQECTPLTSTAAFSNDPNGTLCGNQPANGTSTCTGGVCGISCNAGFTNCGGVCDNESSDVNNCGSCGHVCPTPPNGSPTCAGGACGISCNAGFTNCGGVCDNESSDVNNCGSCGHVCPTPPNGSPTCAGGACGISCNGGFTSCNGGCFVVDSCGVCGGNNAEKGCDGVCFSGKVVDSCGVCGGNNAEKGCDGVCFSGKVVDSCGVCNGNNAEKGCDGVCFSGKVVDSCGVCNGNNAEKGCDGVCFSGKVVDSCGVCGGNNAEKGCDGVCFSGKVVDSCGVCNGNNAEKGCDGVCFSGKVFDVCHICGGSTNLSSDVNNCGSCGHQCPGIANGSAVCSGGSCGEVCNPGLVFCPGAPEGCDHVCGSGAVQDCSGECNGGSVIDCAGRCCGGITAIYCLGYDNCGVCGGSGIDACGVCEGPGPVYSCGCYPCFCPYIYSEGKDGFAYETTVGGASLIGTVNAEEHGSRMQFNPMWARLDRAAIKKGSVSTKILIAEDEIAYVDEAHLTVVEHPVGYEVLSSSSVSSPDPHELYALRTAAFRVPVAASWMEKADVTQGLSSLDDVAVAYDVSADNYYDLDFGAVTDPRNARLVIDGWKFQTTRGLPADVERRDARIEVRQSDGSFKTVLELPYPRGDRKAVTFDLSAVRWPEGAYRMRLWTGTSEAGTAMWYLNRVRLTEEAPVPTRETEVAPSTATLSFSGAPELLGWGNNRPRESVPNGAGRLTSSMLTYGQFTRYGDVRLPLGAVDDMLVVMRKGDVIDLSFERVPAPKKGVEQTLFLRTELLFKPLVCPDCEGPTELSKNVLPLPFHGMTRYPYGSDEHYPTDAAHQRFLEEYLSREYQPGDLRWGP